MELYLGKMVMLEPLDQQQIELLPVEASQQRLQGGLLLRGLADQGVAQGGGRHHLAGTGLAQAMAVLARLVHVEVVVGMLEHPEPQAALAE
ncbi:hypothetical protein D3C78_744900 [compost metagenome]